MFVSLPFLLGHRLPLRCVRHETNQDLVVGAGQYLLPTAEPTDCELDSSLVGLAH